MYLRVFTFQKERCLNTHVCVYAYKALNTKMDERHKSCRVLFYLALFLLPREKIWALAIKCLITTLQFSLLQMVFLTPQRYIGTFLWLGDRIPAIKQHLE